jgi:Ca2+-binding RTX toxin-like protein
MPTPFNSSPTTYFVQSGINSLDALLTEYYNSNSGGKWGGPLGTGANLTYSFPSWANGANPTFSANYGDAPNATYRFGLNTNQQQAVKEALTIWANVANLTFNEVSDDIQVVGDLRFAFTSAVDKETWGFSWLPNSFWPSAADVWINSNIASSLDWSSGTYNFKALMHEIGHGLGLKHPGNYSGNETGPFLLPEIDNRLNTIMSYNGSPNSLWVTYTQSGSRWSWQSETINPQTPMRYDIQAIQYIYGANYSFNSGDTTYSFDSAKPFFQTIWDGGGLDTVSISNFATDCTIDLNPGEFSSLKFTAQTGPSNVNWPSPPAKSTYDGTNNLAIAYNCWIENAIGGSGSDLIYGNDLNNFLDGGNGDDYLDGGSGDDTFDHDIDSRSGNDTFIGGQGNDTYCLSENDVIIENSNEGTDTVWVSGNYTLGNHLENLLVYSNLSNGLTLTGNTTANYIRGGGGNDIINGGGGNDTIDGGLGNDTFILDCLRSQCSGTLFNNTYSLTTDFGSYSLINIEFLRFLDSTIAISEILDTIPPTIAVSTNQNALRIGETASISFTLSEASANFVLADVTASGGTLTNFSGSDTSYMALFTPNSNSTTNGLVSVLNGKFTDAAGNSNADESDSNNTVTMKVDTAPPVVLSLSDGNGASDIALNGNISIKFNEAIKSTVGTVNLFNSTTNKLIQTFDLATALNITASDSTITINPTKDFAYNTAYYLQVSLAQDLSGNTMALTTETFTSTNTYTTFANKYTLSTTPNNLIYSGSSNFTGRGNKNDNFITGNSGNDTLNGALGNDTLTGGLGSDRFVFNTKLGATNIDTITDFTNGDKITLAGSIFTKLRGDKNLSDNFKAAASDSNDYLIYDRVNGKLYYDADGNGKAAAVQFVTLTGNPNLEFSDFIIV